MKLTNKKSSSLVWFFTLVLMAGLIGVIYLASHSNNKGNEAQVDNKTDAAQPKDRPEGNEENIATGTTITTGNSEFGPMLFDTKGQAIYIWQLEDSSTAECYGNCAEEWPPVLTNGTPVASADTNGALLGTTKRTDGTTQVTYNGHPLYFYAHEKPGEVKCHNIRTHGGLWWVIQPSGIRAK